MDLASVVFATNRYCVPTPFGSRHRLNPVVETSLLNFNNNNNNNNNSGGSENNDELTSDCMLLSASENENSAGKLARHICLMWLRS